MMTKHITAIILTYNEEKHIERCLRSLSQVARRVVVVDCYSTDNTVTLARSLGAEIVQHEWVNYSNQFNWALDNVKFDTPWVMRLDADEVVTPELAAALNNELPLYPDTVMGITVNRRVYFLGKWIRHGSMYPIRMLRIWRVGRGHCENRWMDEHIVVNGKIAHIHGDISDINLNNTTWWTTKHNQYASREAVDMLLHRRKLSRKIESAQLNRQARFKRWIKFNFYASLPLGLRALIFFFYRYFLRLGFLDGWQGFAFHFLQGLWYRALVDIKIYELEALMRTHNLSLEQAVRQEFKYEI
jgi:glycosyltransferase involved in cell wall biosynthesis